MPRINHKRRYWEGNKKPQEGRKFVNDRYHNRTWRKLRDSIIASEPLCRNCISMGVRNVANVVDHIKPVSTGKTLEQQEQLMWDVSNLQPLCNSCHNKKSAKEKK